MIYSDITALKSKINQLYSNKTPFFFIVNYEQTEGYCIEAPLNQREIFFKFPNADNKQFAKPSKRITFEVITNNPEEYKSKFEKLQEFIASKEIVFANLTDKTEIKTNASIEDIFALSESRYKQLEFRFVKQKSGKSFTSSIRIATRGDIYNKYPQRRSPNYKKDF
jgi:para-aminobenzoate synthetase component 1